LRNLFYADFRRILRRQMDKPKEYEIRMTIRAQSTLDENALQRVLVIALWEGMDESVLIPDGATDQLRVIEYVETIVEEAV